ncbi:TAXI family TRAP transporter solute-binding subunit [Natronorubrum sp. FCH18a]|uniref:TAXI family TRAP transporter solute-binding subunit n=1 Tax=Natronorubrum sp. FCH18a TaxID=3447018 RepID=UPI003F514C8F
MPNRRAVLAASASTGLGLAAGCLGGDSNLTDVTVGTGSSGSVVFAASQALQRAVREHSDEVALTTQETDGNVANLNLYDDTQEIVMHSCDNATYNDVRENRGEFSDGSVDNIAQQGFVCAIVHIYFLAREDTDIETTDDLRGADVWPIQPGFGTRLLTEEVLANAGLWDDINVMNMSNDDIAGALEEGNVDAIAAYGTNYESLAGWVTQVDAQADMKAVEMTDEFEQAVRDTPGADYEEISMYGWDQDVGVEKGGSYASLTQFLFSSSLDDETVYEIARISHEHIDTVHDAEPAYPDHSDLDVMTRSIIPDYPVAPGVAEFLQDNDAWDDAWTVGE